MVVTLGAAVPPTCATTPSGILEGGWLASPPTLCRLLEADSNKLEAQGGAEPAWEVCAPAPLGPRLSVRSRPALPLAAILPRRAVEPESPPPRLPALHFQNHVRFCRTPFPDPSSHSLVWVPSALQCDPKCLCWRCLPFSPQNVPLLFKININTPSPSLGTVLVHFLKSQIWPE